MAGAEKETVLSALEVRRLHTKSDVDSSTSAQHHTLGMKPNQAASGSHKHDNASGVPLLGGVTLTGSRSSTAALESVIDALVLLGATDSTTA